MRNTLYELPVLLTMLRGGVIAGGAAYLLLLPRRLYYIKRRGKRMGFWRCLLFTLLDIAVCILCSGIFALSLVTANGGELRLYAIAGYSAALFAVIKLLRTLFK